MAPTVRELPSLAPYADEWDQAVAAMALPSPFLRSWWLTALDAGNGAYVLVFDGDRLLGGLPLTKRTLAGLTIYRFVGHSALCPDHLDVVAAPEHLAGVTDALAEWARGRGNRLFDLSGIAEQSRIPSWLPGARTHELDGAPCEPLPPAADDYLATRPRTFRKTVRRTRNRFNEMNACVRRADHTGLDDALDTFERMHRARGDRAGLLAELPRLRRALRQGVERGEAWVDVLATTDRALGVSIAFAACGRVSLYQTARAQDAAAANASTILNVATIERAIDAGCTEADLLRGEEPYKHHYADGVRRLFRTRGGHGPLARAALVGIYVARSARRAIRALRASGAEAGS